MSLQPGPGDTSIFCSCCDEVIYFGESVVMKNHTITRLPDGRARWFQRDFGMVVHECPVEFGVVAEAERIVGTVDRTATPAQFKQALDTETKRWSGLLNRLA